MTSLDLTGGSTPVFIYICLVQAEWLLAPARITAYGITGPRSQGLGIFSFRRGLSPEMYLPPCAFTGLISSDHRFAFKKSTRFNVSRIS